MKMCQLLFYFDLHQNSIYSEYKTAYIENKFVDKR